MLLKQLNKLDERDFAVLRGPLESGRQSPKSIAGILVMSTFILALFVYLMYLMTTSNTNFPYKDLVFYIYSVVTILLIIGALFYSIPAIYKRGQKMQYFMMVLVSQFIFGLFFFLTTLLLLGMNRYFLFDESSLIMIAIMLLAGGFILFVFTWIRFIILLRRGEYRTGSKKWRLRNRFEGKTIVPTAIIVGTSLSLLVQSVFNNMFIFEGNVIMVVIGSPLLFFTMLFILPEQLVILYCKYRFESFNFDKDGQLIPMINEVDEVNEI